MSLVTARLARRTWIAGALAAPLALAACSGGGGGESGAASDGGASGDFSPVTIEHALGTAEITEKPQRVVTLGQGSAASVLLFLLTIGLILASRRFNSQIEEQ